MAGILHTLNTARQGLSAQQLGLNVTGHNISNVNNPDFSRQSVPQAASTPILQSGFLIGTGVASQQIRQTADQLLEDRITEQKSAFSASEAFMTYMKALGNMFNESSDSSISSLLPQFSDAWNTLANNPDGASERMNVYENGLKLSENFNLMDRNFSKIEQDLNQDLQGGVAEINRLGTEIARLNQAIMGQETSRTSNDNRDLRNQLVKELAQWTDIKSFEDSNGALTVTVAGGFSLVSGAASYGLSFESSQVTWQSSSGSYVDITDRIQGGALGGWLEMRDVELPRYRQEMDALARETIWHVNRLHSQGAGTEYDTGVLSGTYAPRQSNWLASLPYGDRIDYTKDFGLWMENRATLPPGYGETVVDMGISTAQPTAWTGSAPELGNVRYDFTVVRSGTTGESLWLADGQNLASVQAAESLEAALTQALRSQTLTLTDASGAVQTLEIGQASGKIPPSAAAISDALNAVDGLQAYSLPNRMTLDISTLLPGVGGMQQGDEVGFTFVSGTVREELIFRVGADDVETRGNFAAALDAVVDQVADLSVSYNGDEAVLESSRGENLGISDFRVMDNARITLDNFVEDTGGPGAASFSLAGVDITFSLDLSGGQTGAADNLFAALNRESTALKAQGISWERNAAGTGVEIWGAGGKALDIAGLDSHGGNDDGGFTLSGASGTLVGGVDAGVQVLAENGVRAVAVAPDSLATGTLGAEGTALVTGGNDSAVKVSTLTIFAAPGMRIQSDAQPGLGSLFNVAAHTDLPAGNAVLTLGGDGGFSAFDTGDVLSFTLDGQPVAYTVAPGDSTDRDFAAGLSQALGAAGLDPSRYRIAQTGASVSIVRTDGEALRLSDFQDTGTGDASLRVVTGSGFGLEGPATLLLQSGAGEVAESAVFGTGAAIEWRKYDVDGNDTGVSGRIDVQDSGPYGVEGDLAFQLSPGTLVAGNTFSMNTNATGRPAPLEMTVKGRAGSVNDSYLFTVKPPGGAVGEESVTLMWESRYGSGEVTVAVDSRTRPPVYVEVDGMRLGFESGTLFKDDLFIIETDAAGNGCMTRASDWHWTTDSFAAQFNRQGEGVSARVLQDGRLAFTNTPQTYEVSDLGCSGVNGFCDVNTRVSVLDATSLNMEALDFRLARDAGGNWAIQNDYTHGLAQLVPPGGDDSGFGIDLTGNGLADIALHFDQPVTGSGFVEFDITARNQENYAFAFSGDAAHNSGLAAALGMNTFFNGTDARTMGVNGRLAELNNLNAGTLDGLTGEIRKGDNSMARALADLQDSTIRFEEWQFSRNGKAVSAQADATLEGYYQMMTGSVGVRYQAEQRSLSFYGVMLSNLGQQRDSISAVSLDEEMVNLIKYQQAFTAAAKLITVSDEMLTTLVNMR